VPGFEVLEKLGEGGMGVVYKARQLVPGRVVALKMILAGGHARPADVSRLRREAEAVARLQHPNVVQLFQVGDCNHLPYLCMEFCAGGSLARRLQNALFSLEPLQAGDWLEKLARAVEYAHQRGVLHRDLKPANILLTEEDIPKVSDFGLAKCLDDISSPTQTQTQTQTHSDDVLGTPSYMAPEQAQGKTREIGPAADVYALGAILYECLTGRPPFKAATALETLRQVLAEDPVPPRQLNPAVPRDLETVPEVPGERSTAALSLGGGAGRRAGPGSPRRANPGLPRGAGGTAGEVVPAAAGGGGVARVVRGGLAGVADSRRGGKAARDAEKVRAFAGLHLPQAGRKAQEDEAALPQTQHCASQ
jgi:serine/threonine protein kinase